MLLSTNIINYKILHCLHFGIHIINFRICNSSLQEERVTTGPRRGNQHH